MERRRVLVWGASAIGVSGAIPLGGCLETEDPRADSPLEVVAIWTKPLDTGNIAALVRVRNPNADPDSGKLIVQIDLPDEDVYTRIRSVLVSAEDINDFEFEFRRPQVGLLDEDRIRADAWIHGNRDA